MTLLITDSEELTKLLDTVKKESKKKKLLIVKRQNTQLSVKDSTCCELCIRDFKIKQIQKFNHLGSVLKVDEKGDTKI